MTVLHCVTGLNIGGAEMMLANLLEQPSSFRWSVLSLLTPGALAARVSNAGAQLQSLSMTPESLAAAKIPALRRAVGRAAPDLIHGWMHHGIIAATVGAAGLGCPVIWGVHHSIGALEREKPRTRRMIWLAALLSRRAAAITYPSRHTAEQYEQLGFDPGRRVIMPNGVNCAVFKPDPTGRERLVSLLGIPPDRLIVGHVARFDPMKDQATLIRAIATLRAEGVDLHLVVVGPGHENGALVRMAAEAGIGDRISVIGPTFGVAGLMPGLDVHVITSAWGETFSLATAEAMACGVPAVVTDLGDCRWVVGEDDFTVRPGDPDGVAAALRRILVLDAGERRRLGLAGRERIVSLFSHEQYATRHNELYERFT